MATKNFRKYWMNDALLVLRNSSWSNCESVTLVRRPLTHGVVLRETRVLRRSTPILSPPRITLGQPLKKDFKGYVSSVLCQTRYYCSENKVDNEALDKNDQSKDPDVRNEDSLGEIKPRMAMVFTCKVCSTRAAKTFSKLAYEKGIVIIRCPGCDSHHLIADNLGWFEHFEHRNVEEMLAAKGEQVKKMLADENINLTVDDIAGTENLEKIQELLHLEQQSDNS